MIKALFSCDDVVALPNGDRDEEELEKENMKECFIFNVTDDFCVLRKIGHLVLILGSKALKDVKIQGNWYAQQYALILSLNFVI